MVGHKLSTGNKKGGGEIPKKSPVAEDKPKPIPRSTKILRKVRSGFVTKSRKVKYADKYCQAGINADIELLTGTGEPPLRYWKDLAETRRQALEDSLIENEILHKRVEELQHENHDLEEMLHDAKQLAEMISSISGEDADESGIGSEDLEQSC